LKNNTLQANVKTLPETFLIPFNARAGHHRGRHFFGHNSPAAIARELFKPSTDSASLLVATKKIFDLGLAFSLGDVTKRACF